MKKVVLFSPSRLSLYTVSMAELLQREEDIQVVGVFVRRLINRHRLITEFRRDGRLLWGEIWNKLVLRQHTYGDTAYDTMATFMREHAIEHGNIDTWGRARGVGVTYCNDLNDAVVVSGLDALQPDIVVLTGGGMIRTDVLQRAGHGILNCHMGILPDYRGMDVVEWPLLEGRPDCVGTTVHFMDAGLDTGDIVQEHRIAVHAGQSITQLRQRFEPIMCRQMLETCLGVLRGTHERRPQNPEVGKQYFRMHPALQEIAAQRLEQLAAPNPD